MTGVFATLTSSFPTLLLGIATVVTVPTLRVIDVEAEEDPPPVRRGTSHCWLALAVEGRLLSEMSGSEETLVVVDLWR